MELLRLLAEVGANVNTPNNNGATPAFIAAQNGHTEVLEVLKRYTKETEEEAAEREEQLLKAFEDLEVHAQQTFHARAESKSTR